MTAAHSTIDHLRGALAFCLAQLRAGRSTHQATAGAGLVARTWGPKHVQVVALGRAVLVEHPTETGVPTTVIGTVPSLDGFNCDHMKQLKDLEREVLHHGMTATEAEKQLQVIAHSRRPLWWTWGGGMLLSFCVAMQVAFEWSAAFGAALLWLVSCSIGLVASHLRLPRLFTMMLQTAVVVLIALPISQTDALSPRQAAIAVGTVAMLLVPLPQIISTIVDAIDGHAQGAVTRGVSLLTALTGIGIGVAIGMTVARLPLDSHQVALDLPVLSVGGVLFFSVLGSLGNALSNAGGVDLLVPAAIIGLFTAGVHTVLLDVADMPALWAAGTSALLLGIVAALWAARSAYSSTALALIGVTGALLPGLTVYQGMYAEVFEPARGLDFFLSAAGTVAALAIGTSLGFVIVERLIMRSIRATGHADRDHHAPAA